MVRDQNGQTKMDRDQNRHRLRLQGDEACSIRLSVRSAVCLACSDVRGSAGTELQNCVSESLIRYGGLIMKRHTSMHTRGYYRYCFQLLILTTCNKYREIE